MERKKIYEVEIQRSGVTPRRFWGICKREIERRSAYRVRLADWLDGFEAWENPATICNTSNPEEICKTKPLEFQFYLRGGYNFIMEFDYFDDKTGNGYLYIVEFDR